MGIRTKLGISTIVLSAYVAVSSPVLAVEAVNYTYDVLGRVIRVQYVGGLNNGRVIVYSYDAAGNRSTVVVS